jgi:hypothetical protein
MSSVDEALESFRLASRELFNGFFRVTHDPFANGGWALLERFERVEEVLFEQMVAPACTSGAQRYGQAQPSISVALRAGDVAPIMINREVDSGYWDHPVNLLTRDASLRFVRFFDWDQLGPRDNRYLRVVVQSWPGRPEVEGKHALVESHYAAYREA